ncbi:MAG TPA: hypothetical protein PLG99_03845, partial [Kaistiaceae bacterium]|nr:hypothetical protein [Kaistiaceae bacterium]
MSKVATGRNSRFLKVRTPVSRRQILISAFAIWIAFFAVWIAATAMGWVNPILVPSPVDVFGTTVRLFTDQGFGADVLISIARVLAAFALASLVAVPLGVAAGIWRWVG